MHNIANDFEKLFGAKVYSIQNMDKGLSNTNYLINDRYVFRHKNSKNQLFYHACEEYKIELAMKPLHLSFYIECFDVKTGDKITIYEPLAKEFDPKKYNTNQLKQIAQAISAIHHLPYVSKIYFEPFKRLKKYKSRSHLPFLNKNLENSIIDNAKTWYDKADLCLCHNDLVQGNILFIEDEIRIIDYEFSSMNDPFFDIVSFLSENNIIKKEDVILFLRLYYKDQYEDVLLKKFSDYLRMQDLLWYYWAGWMYYLEKKNVYLLIANEKKNRLFSFQSLAL